MAVANNLIYLRFVQIYLFVFIPTRYTTDVATSPEEAQTE